MTRKSTGSVCCGLNAHLNIVLFFLLGFGLHYVPQPPVTIWSRVLPCLIFEQIFIHIRRLLSIKNIKKLSNKLFAELFSLQTLSPVSFTLTVQDFTEK